MHQSRSRIESANSVKARTRFPSGDRVFACGLSCLQHLHEPLPFAPYSGQGERRVLGLPQLPEGKGRGGKGW